MKRVIVEESGTLLIPFEVEFRMLIGKGDKKFKIQNIIIHEDGNYDDIGDSYIMSDIEVLELIDEEDFLVRHVSDKVSELQLLKLDKTKFYSK